MAKLSDEIKQRKPFGSLAEEVALNLVRTTDHVNAAHAELLKPFGLTPSQYNVLRILRGAGPDGHPCQEIGARLITRVPDVTRLIDRLEAQGFVERVRGTEDRRVVRVVILAPALDLLKRLDAPVNAMAPRLFAALTAGELTTLKRLLERLRDAAGPEPADRA